VTFDVLSQRAFEQAAAAAALGCLPMDAVLKPRRK
jgi:hypothetical protein